MVTKKKETTTNQTKILINSFETFKEWVAINKLNPLEKQMAIELLLHNYSFYPQYKIDLPEGCVANGRKYFVVDFLIPLVNIIIETDGKIHLTEENQIKDRYKDNFLTAFGYRVFRFDWDEIMGKNENWDIFNLIDIIALKETIPTNKSMPNFQ